MSGALFGQFGIHKRLCLGGGCRAVLAEVKLHLMGSCNLLRFAPLILENITCRFSVRVVELFRFSQVLKLGSTFPCQTRSLQCPNSPAGHDPHYSFVLRGVTWLKSCFSVPDVGNILVLCCAAAIRRKKSRDTYILGSVVAACTVFLLLYWLSK
jgi:hypothetical protein